MTDTILRGVAWLICACALVGCGAMDSLLGKEANPDCRGPKCPLPPDGGNMCASNADCAPSGVCDITGSKQCVQCTQDQTNLCTAAMPACGTDHMCRACQAHTECPLSNACLPDGSCAAEADVAYVDPAGTNTMMCSKAMPCGKFKDALMTMRPYLKVHGTIDETVTINRKTALTLLADPGATLTHAGNGGGAVLTIGNEVPMLAIYDLAIANISDINMTALAVPSGTLDGPPEVSLTRAAILDNAGSGIAISGGSFTISQSRIIRNQRGGLRISDAKFAIVGNLFIANGALTSARGALEISVAEAPSNRLEFNSFYKNIASDGVSNAIQCAAGKFTARNNILFGNGTATNLEPVGGSCAHAYSIIQPGTLPPGMGNLAADPLFKDGIRNDLHLLPGSPAIRAADPGSDLTGLAARDLDGISRTRPATLGAYQMP